MLDEIYKSLKNFEHIYKISNFGNIINIKTSKNKKYCIKNNGYYYVTLCKNGISYPKTVHSLVAETFLSKNKNEIIDHIDGNKLNNNISNLRYTSYSINTINAYKNNKNMSKKLRKVYKFDDKYKLIKIYNSLSECRKDNKFKFNSKIVNLSNSKKMYNKCYYTLENKKKVITSNTCNIISKENFIDIDEYFDDNYSNYSVSQYGNILNKRTNKFMKKLKNDYEKIILLNDNKEPKKINIHRLVAYKFLKKYDNSKVINHLDENKQNNYYKNLEITTTKKNVRYSNSKKILKYDLNMNLIKKYDCIKDASNELNIKNSGNIIKCCKGKIKTAYKFIWKYND